VTPSALAIGATRTASGPPFRAFTPSRALTFLVAAGLLALSWLSLALVHVLPSPLGARGLWAAGAAAALLFALRTVGDFRLAGVFKQVLGTRFARWDDLLFTPLCFLLSASLACSSADAAEPRAHRTPR
jgi:hypothetical protein